MTAMLALLALLPLLASAAPAKRAYTPSGPANPNYIHPNGNNDYCLVVKGTPANDVPVTVDLCSSSQYNRFDLPIYSDTANLVLTGTNFCVDAGIGPHNNGPAKLYECFNNLEQQTWIYNTDSTIALSMGNSNQCLDVTNGQIPGSLQTYQCTPGNTNQKFTYQGALNPTTTPSATSSAPRPTGTIMPAGQRIHFDGDSTQCLSVTSTYDGITDGTAVGIAPCLANNAGGVQTQLWNIQKGTTSVQLTGTNYCLDFGTNPNDNGVMGKVWTCYPGLTQQTFYYTDDNRIAIQGGTTCLDKTANAPAQSQGSFSYFPVQSYQCTTGDTQQVWTL